MLKNRRSWKRVCQRVSKQIFQALSDFGLDLISITSKHLSIALPMNEISEDDDLAYALSLQQELGQEINEEKSSYDYGASSSSKLTTPVSVVDDSWELIDPIPDVRQLFLQFNDVYFNGLLASVEVRWSPRMTL